MTLTSVRSIQEHEKSIHFICYFTHYVSFYYRCEPKFWQHSNINPENTLGVLWLTLAIMHMKNCVVKTSEEKSFLSRGSIYFISICIVTTILSGSIISFLQLQGSNCEIEFCVFRNSARNLNWFLLQKFSIYDLIICFITYSPHYIKLFGKKG